MYLLLEARYHIVLFSLVLTSVPCFSTTNLNHSYMKRFVVLCLFGFCFYVFGGYLWIPPLKQSTTQRNAELS